MRPTFRHLVKPVAIACALAGAGPVHAASQNIQVNASVVKPLTLAWLQNLDLGSIVLGPGSWSGATVSISRAGIFTCTSSNLTCSGATQVAKYRVTGSNRETVRITAPNVTLVNQNDTSKTLLLVIDSPGSAVLPNSGVPGVDIGIGGSISLTSATPGGVYTGTFNVTVDY